MKIRKLLYTTYGVACLLLAAILLHKVDNMSDNLSKSSEVVEESIVATQKTASNKNDGGKTKYVTEELQDNHDTMVAMSKNRESRKNLGYMKETYYSDSCSQNPRGNVSVGLVDLNSASEEELDTLPGIGAKTATLIIEYRRTHGCFERKEDLLEIKGIGVKKYKKLKDKVTVGN